MNIKDFLENMDSNKFVYIGARSGWLFIGESDKAIDFLKKTDDMEVRRLKNKYNKAKRGYFGFDDYLENGRCMYETLELNYEIDKELLEVRKKNVDNFSGKLRKRYIDCSRKISMKNANRKRQMKKKENLFNDVERYKMDKKKNYETAKNNYNSYVRILKRNVKEVYEHESDVHGTAILIEGNENSKFCTLEEFNKSIGKGDDGVIIIDSREKKFSNVKRYFDRNKIKYKIEKLDVGDYMSDKNDKLVVDRKASLDEIASNLCTKDNNRFYRELHRAMENKVKIIFLIEKKINSFKDVISWKSKYSKINGSMVLDRMAKIELSYNVEFRFCHKNSTGKQIIEILGESENDK